MSVTIYQGPTQFSDNNCVIPRFVTSVAEKVFLDMGNFEQLALGF